MNQVVPQVFLPANSKYVQKHAKDGLIAQIAACTGSDVDSAVVHPALNFETGLNVP
jgi:hypothetical protein